MKCKNCGHELENDDWACPNCDYIVKKKLTDEEKKAQKMFNKNIIFYFKMEELKMTETINKVELWSQEGIDVVDFLKRMFENCDTLSEIAEAIKDGKNALNKLGGAMEYMLDIKPKLKRFEEGLFDEDGNAVFHDDEAIEGEYTTSLTVVGAADDEDKEYQCGKCGDLFTLDKYIECADGNYGCPNCGFEQKLLEKAPIEVKCEYCLKAFMLGDTVISRDGDIACKDCDAEINKFPEDAVVFKAELAWKCDECAKNYKAGDFYGDINGLDLCLDCCIKASK